MKKLCSTLLTASLLVLIQGCAGNKPYRTTAWEKKTPNAVIAAQTLEKTGEYDLGFIEFDDQGALWNPEQQAAVVNRLSEIGKTQGVMLVVFVHGWKHNASQDDANVQLVREALTGLYKDEAKSSAEEKRQPLRIMGVYVGWRGLSFKVPMLKNLSFWTRKNTAHEVGYGAVAETFIRLENEILRSNKIENEPPADAKEPGAARTRSSMISVGHSFGGAVLYSALSGILTDRIISREEGITGGASGLGDLVILINPAFEANRIVPLIDGTKKRPNAMTGPRRPALAVFTSQGDWATKVAFPIGRILSTRHESYRSKLQKSGDRTAVGHFDHILTHRLKAKPPGNPPRTTDSIRKDPSASKVQEARQEVKSQKESGMLGTVEYSQTILEPVDPKSEVTPVLVVSVENSIINGHNDIAKPIFLNFLSEFIISFSERPTE